MKTLQFIRLHIFNVRISSPWSTPHPGLTRGRCLRLLLFKFNYVFVYSSTILNVLSCLFSFLFKTKGEKIMFNRPNYDRKSHFSLRRTEPFELPFPPDIALYLDVRYANWVSGSYFHFPETRLNLIFIWYYRDWKRIQVILHFQCGMSDSQRYNLYVPLPDQE